VGTVHRSGTPTDAKRARKRPRRSCRSAPETPTGVTLTFHKRERRKKEFWVGRANWDAVTEDVADRGIQPEEYHVQLQAVDASGDPVETKGQESTFHARGKDFTVQGGSAPTNRLERELNASGDVIQHTLTGLTTGIQVQVDCYARKDAGGSAPRIKCEIWNVSAGSSVVSKNVEPDHVNHPRLGASLKFTPAAATTYAIRVSWVSGSGVALFHQAEWHDKGDDAVWNRRIPADQPERIGFPDLPRPRVWYYQVRVRAMNRVRGTKCWSAWSAWTTPTNPVTGDPQGPPTVTGVTLTFDASENRKNRKWDAVVTWDEVANWLEPDGDVVEGAERYAIQLQVSEDGSTPIKTRRRVIAARDEDADLTKDTTFHDVRKRRYFRARVRPIDKDGARGAWSDWTSWLRASQTVDNPLNVQHVKVKPGVHKVTWDPPSDESDVDKYRVRVFVLGVLKETVYTRAEHIRYVVPDADRGKAHRFKITAIDEDANLSAEVDKGSDETDDEDPAAGGGEGFEVGDIRKLAGPGITTWLSNHPKWLRANGQLLSTTSYPDLFAEIGYTHGGAGSVFAVPDMNGRQAVGASSLLTVGMDDGDPEANRGTTHLHSNDQTDTDLTDDQTDGLPGADGTFGNPATDSTGESGHRHGHSNMPSTGPPGTTVDKAGGGGSAAGPAHTHSISGFLSDFNFDNHGHGHNHGGHQHFHGHGSHKHIHKHNQHRHQHGHDAKKRPHKVVHFVIKALP
jgi:tail collar domain